MTPPGDAIHLMTPAAGSGADTALRDAALLTEQLADVAFDAVHLPLRNSNLEHLLP